MDFISGGIFANLFVHFVFMESNSGSPGHMNMTYLRKPIKPHHHEGSVGSTSTSYDLPAWMRAVACQILGLGLGAHGGCVQEADRAAAWTCLLRWKVQI